MGALYLLRGLQYYPLGVSLPSLVLFAPGTHLSESRPTRSLVHPPPPSHSGIRFPCQHLGYYTVSRVNTSVISLGTALPLWQMAADIRGVPWKVISKLISSKRGPNNDRERCAHGVSAGSVLWRQRLWVQPSRGLLSQTCPIHLGGVPTVEEGLLRRKKYSDCQRLLLS